MSTSGRIRGISTVYIFPATSPLNLPVGALSVLKWDGILSRYSSKSVEARNLLERRVLINPSETLAQDGSYTQQSLVGGGLVTDIHPRARPAGISINKEHLDQL